MVLLSVAVKKGTKMADHFDEGFRDSIPAWQDGVKAKPCRSLHEPREEVKIKPIADAVSVWN